MPLFIAVFAETDAQGSGVGSFINGNDGIAGNFQITNAANNNVAVNAFTLGGGPAITAVSFSGNGVNALGFSNTAINNGIYAYHAVIPSLPPTSPGGWAGLFSGDVRVNGNLSKATLNAFVKNGSGDEKLIYAEESAEYWSTDYGFGQLVNGLVTINIEQEFLSTVNCTVPYHIFVQMLGPCNNAGVYVTNKTATSFDVVQQHSGNDCNTSFSYTIRAKRKGFENLRMATQAQTSSATQQYIQTYFPEIISQNEQKIAEIQQQNNSAIPDNYSFPSQTTPPSLIQRPVPTNIVTHNNSATQPPPPVEIAVPEPYILPH